jgi:RNA polymerase sigma-70 factor (ECF subfamily)
MGHSPPFSDERLIAELGWVRALARQLVKDTGLAEDVVQETWLLARERPPRTTAVRGLRRWLARVARSVAIRHLRGERARAWRERAVATPERADDSPPELLERATTHKLLMAAVLELEDPYRSAVLMRFVDGLEPDEIAHKQGISRENARQRVSRGLALVRRRLERELGSEDRRWARALVPLCAPERRELPWTETILMSTAAKVLGSAALVSVGWVLWNGPARDEGAATTALVPAERAHEPETLAQDGLAPAASGDTGRTAAAVVPAAETLALAAPDTPHVFRARLLGGDGRALTGATLHMPVRFDVAPARSDASGHAELAVAGEIPLEPGNLSALVDGLEPDPATGFVMLQAHTDDPLGVLVVASAAGHSSVERFVELGDERVHELGEFRLQAVGTIIGRLLGPGLEPLPAHPVRLARPTAGIDREPERRRTGPDYPALHAELRTDAEGRFRFDGAPEGLWNVWGGGEGFLWTSGPLFRLTRTEAVPELELVLDALPPGSEFRGRVLRPDGTPSIETRVQAVPSGDPELHYWREALTDHEGRFAMPATPGLSYDLTAHGRGFSRLPVDAPRAHTLLGVVAGARELELHLQESLTLEVLVSDAEGRAVRAFELFAPGEGLVAHWHREVEDELGRGRVEVPDHAFRVLVRAEGFADADLGVFTPEDAPRTLAVTLERLARVRGHVRAHGRALSGALVELVRLADGHSIHVMEGFPSRWDQSVYRRTESDERGEFDLPILARGSFALRAEHAGLAPLELGPFELDPRRGERVDFELGQGGALAGRVLVPPDQDPAGVLVKIGRGDGRAQRAITDAAGRYRFERLMPGRYMAEASYVRVEERGGGFEPIETIVSEEEFEFPWALEIFAGETTEHDIDLARQDVARVEGTLRIDGRAHDVASVRILPGYHPWNDTNSPLLVEHGLESGGRFVFEEQRAGPAWLVLGLGGAPLDGVLVVRRVVLERGENRVDFELSSAGLGGPRPAGEAALALLARLDDETFALLTLADDVPYLHLPGVPAATEAWLVERQASGDPFTWKKRAEFGLAAGQWTALE